MAAYNPKEIEPEILEFWNKHSIYEKATKKNRGKKKFYFIDGPPYTSGSIHLGHAWNKALKDCILRYKRMAGFDAWAQPGFDMHGLPIEVAVEKKLGIKAKHEIIEKLGVNRFIQECESFSLEQMHPMIKDFTRMGVWMDWQNPYMSIKNEYIEGAWWALAQADRNGYLYQGKKSMTWCPRCATALAKHELTYKDVDDPSVYAKFPVTGKEKTYLLIWTTTPWTLPFNLALMAHPDFDYVTAKAGDETWILAKALLGQVSEACKTELKVEHEYKGSELLGTKYTTPFQEMPFHGTNTAEKAYTVVMSDQYVDLSAGTGLVHTAPGCGPEDFEVGKKNNLPAYNTLDEQGKFTDAGELTGLQAKKDDDTIIKSLEQKGLLAASLKYRHEYAHCWRCDTAVVFRATVQWFLAVEKLKGQMLKENEKVLWVPDWGGARWFESWLQNIQDWCISRQRFWGIPLPIWKCDKCEKTRVIGTREELPKKLDNLHIPWIDSVKLQCSCGSAMTRVPDVLDVWLDSGAASWAPLHYPSSEELFSRLWPADFILEGKDQIRGWFNSMICLSMVSHRKSAYKAVYMHGFVNDAMGRKMSKSLKNTISPYEVIDSYGADTLRYYAIGGAKPGFDLNYNFEDMKLKHKNLLVFWNIQNFLLELADTASMESERAMSVEERFILSRLNTAIERATYMMDNYYINEVPWVAEELLLELSRGYIQLVRDKATGTEEEKNAVLYTVFRTFTEGLKLLAPIAPFITEKIYQNLKQKFSLKEESIHLFSWPQTDKKSIDEELEKEFAAAKSAIQAILSIREKEKTGIRWPLQEAIIISEALTSEEVLAAVEKQANIKQARIAKGIEGARTSVKADYEKLLPQFGRNATRIVAALAMTSPETILRYIERDGEFALNIDNEKAILTQDHLIITKQPPHGYEYAAFDKGEVYVNIMSSPELEAEGYARELIRRIQSMRKQAGMSKPQHITLEVNVPRELAAMLQPHLHQIKEKVGARTIRLSEKLNEAMQHKAKERIKDKEIEIGFSIV
ncbi:isoleucine--tRNA ligase [Candidatus Woesearchaeota archaeon]|nr:isoleucine--tRNA ligase [Candidatus Woesearchaeota archaeon]